MPAVIPHSAYTHAVIPHSEHVLASGSFFDLFFVLFGLFLRLFFPLFLSGGHLLLSGFVAGICNFKISQKCPYHLDFLGAFLIGTNLFLRAPPPCRRPPFLETLWFRGVVVRSVGGQENIVNYVVLGDRSARNLVIYDVLWFETWRNLGLAAFWGSKTQPNRGFGSSEVPKPRILRGFGGLRNRGFQVWKA